MPKFSTLSRGREMAYVGAIIGFAFVIGVLIWQDPPWDYFE
jgi:hypothetical protein